jgi:polysaccharide export outer membrane protein
MARNPVIRFDGCTALVVLAGLCLYSARGTADGWDEFEQIRTGGYGPSAMAVTASEPPERATAAVGGLTLPRNAQAQYEYRIGSHDVLQIEVFQVEELNHTTRVNSRGYISVPLLGQVEVGGLTVGEAERRIADALGRDYLQNPHVSIFVAEYESQKFTVEGEVKDPGVFPIKGPTTLLQAIAMADGLAKLADDEEIVLFRTDGNTGRTAGFIVDINKLRSGEKEDPLIANGDMIVVPQAGNKAFIEGLANTLRGFIGFGLL